MTPFSLPFILSLRHIWLGCAHFLWHLCLCASLSVCAPLLLEEVNVYTHTHIHLYLKWRSANSVFHQHNLISMYGEFEFNSGNIQDLLCMIYQYMLFKSKKHVCFCQNVMNLIAFSIYYFLLRGILYGNGMVMVVITYIILSTSCHSIPIWLFFYSTLRRI